MFCFNSRWVVHFGVNMYLDEHRMLIPLWIFTYIYSFTCLQNCMFISIYARVFICFSKQTYFSLKIYSLSIFTHLILFHQEIYLFDENVNLIIRQVTSTLFSTSSFAFVKCSSSQSYFLRIYTCAFLFHTSKLFSDNKRSNLSFGRGFNSPCILWWYIILGYLFIICP